MEIGTTNVTRKDSPMKGSTTVPRSGVESLTVSLAENLGVEPSMVLPFADFTETITAYLTHVSEPGGRLIVAGHATPEIQLAADRAEMEISEVIGITPFVGHVEDVLEMLASSSDVIYLANPNWVTGSNYSTKDIERLAEATGDGALILDEKLFDFYGISGIGMLERYANVIVLRSLTAGFGIDADESGFLVGAPGLISSFGDALGTNGFTATRLRIINLTLASEDARTQRLAMVQDESLRVASRLTKLGVQNRMTSADFLLLRVADPQRVGNFMARYGVALGNLDGYPDLQHYVKYCMQSPLSNDNFLTAFSRMPKEYYHMDGIDRRAVMFNRPGSRKKTAHETAGRSVVMAVEDK